jgi:hypothetical protein
MTVRAAWIADLMRLVESEGQPPVAYGEWFVRAKVDQARHLDSMTGWTSGSLLPGIRRSTTSRTRRPCHPFSGTACCQRGPWLTAMTSTLGIVRQTSLYGANY